jgi:hypothetical protein
MTDQILHLENNMQYSVFTDYKKGEYWLCSPHNGAPLMRISSDVQHILHLLNSGRYHVKVTQVTKQCTTTKGYYQDWQYSIA